MTQDVAPPVRLAELIASLSLATDLAMGQPMEQALRTCVLSTKLAGEAGVAGQDLRDVYYFALLRFVGCTADAHESASAAGGNEIADRAGLATVIMGGTPEVLGYMLRRFARDTPPLTRLRLVAGALTEGKGAASRQLASHCEVAQMLAARMGLPQSVALTVGASFERWDGKGLPGDLAGQAIPVAARVVAISRDVDIFNRLGSWDLVADVLQRRRGKAYDPALTDLFLANGQAWLAGLDSAPIWEQVIRAEPAPVSSVPESQLDEVLGAFADFVDLKLPFTPGHSSTVAQLAAKAAMHAGLPPEEVRRVRRAALLHDLGKAGVPNGVLEKKSPLSTSEWEQVRLHPYYTERILSRCTALAGLAPLAASSHERTDGSGYHRGLSGSAIPVAARILAAANTCVSLAEGRPHRPALSESDRVSYLREESARGRLDPDAVRCVLSAAGQPTPPVRTTWPKGLTDREVEVLRLISRGHSKNEVAQELTISTKTVGRHVENIYTKIGVSSRAAAALFAVEHELIRP